MGFAACAGVAHAELTRLEVATRVDIGDSGYEKIVGVAHFAVDPKDARNKVIADIDKAPRNNAGRVEFSADIYIIRSKVEARSNGIAAVDVLNRGNKLLLSYFTRGASSDPRVATDLGDRFLLNMGFTLVWIGWEFDIQRKGSALGISVPVAVGVTEIVRADYTPGNGHSQQTFGDLVGYAPLDAASRDSTLTVRDEHFGASTVIDRSRWTLSGNTVTLTGGFEPGRIYQLAYRAKEMPISGLGMAAFRDAAAWLKHSPDAPVHPRQLLTFGASQSGRFLRTYLYHGFNTDEKGRQVFDAAWMHVAGAAGLSLNERGATPTSLTPYRITTFPFASAAMRDPITGRVDGLLDNPRARRHQPKMFLTNSSVEYWGIGRSAAFVHISPDGARDLTLAANERVYFLAGAPHGTAPFPAAVTDAQQPDNPLESVWTMRALMASMEQWMRSGTPPPPSRYPRLADGTLSPVSALAFPALPGVQAPTIVHGTRTNGIARPLLVPQVDADGNEVAGIRSAESRVPLATYTGWNFRHATVGGTKLLANLRGARIPFPRTAADRAASHDPRRSLDERYASRNAYLTEARRATEALVAERHLLPQDVAEVMKRMELQWATAIATRGPTR